MKPNIYEITYSLKTKPNEWSSFSCEENKIQNTLAIVLATKDWQLECVALVKSSNSNRYDISSE